MTRPPLPHPDHPSRPDRRAAYPAVFGHGVPQPTVGYPNPMGPAGFKPTPPGPPKKSRAGLIILVAVLVVVLGVGGFFGVRALTSNDSGSTGGAGSGEVVSPPGKPYTVEIPTGVERIAPHKDSSIPSDTDLSLVLPGKAGDGGMIKTGTLAGPAATGRFDEVGLEAAEGYSHEYEGHPDDWGTGARVDHTMTTLGGQDAVRVDVRFSPDGDPTPSIFFRGYFINPPLPGSPAILITCDWNTTSGTEPIQHACATLVASFKITKSGS
jgi:hypothetical protein